MAACGESAMGAARQTRTKEIRRREADANRNMYIPLYSAGASVARRRNISRTK